MYLPATSSPGTSLKKSTPHTMSTLHEEQHSDTEEELATVKSDEPAVTPVKQKVESVTSTVTATIVTASQPDPENQNEFEANQVKKNKINYFFHVIFIFVKLRSFIPEQFLVEWTKNSFILNRFMTLFLLFQWQWRFVSRNSHYFCVREFELFSVVCSPMRNVFFLTW